MARINNTTTFPITAPASDDLVIGTDVSDTTNSADGETVNFKFSDILGLTPTATEFVQVYEPDNTIANVEFALPDSSVFGGVVFEFAGVGHGSGTDRRLTLRFSTDGGSTFLTSSYFSAGTSAPDTTSIYLTDNVDNTSGIGVSGIVRVHGYGRTDVRTTVTTNLIAEGSSGGTVEKYNGAGMFVATTEVTHVQFRLEGENFRDGHIIMRANKIV